MEETVDDLVERAVATHRHNDWARFPNRTLSHLCRLERTRCKRGFVLEAGRRQPALHHRPLPTGPAATGGGVDDEQDRRAGMAAYGTPPMLFGFMIPSGSIPSFTALHTHTQPPISSATHLARARPTP